jgi:serine/threonine protein kinase
LVLLIPVLYTKKQCNCKDEDHPKIEYRFLLTDFGFTKPFKGQTHSSGRFGSERYRAPELTNDNTFSDKTDIWAFGCLLVELSSTGRLSAFKDDWAAARYAKEEEGFNLPCLQSRHNPVLGKKSLERINILMSWCFRPKPQDRPVARTLLAYFESWAKNWNNE